MRSYQILQFQWLNSNNCNGSPNVMYSINVDSLEDTHPRINQSWPGMLTMQMRDAPYGTCGIAAFSVNDQCCSQSLDTSRDFSNGYLSGRPSLIDTADIMTKMPLGSNGHQYCNISHIGAVTNYNFVALLADDTVCIDEYYRCFSNHSISVYSDSNCLGSSNNYILPDTHQSISGLGEGSFIEIKGGKSTNSWITYVPGTLAVAPVGSINGIVQNCAFVISFTSDVVLLYYLAKKASKGVTIFIYCGFVTQTLWVCHIMVYYYFWRVPLPYRMSSAHLQSTLFGIVGTLSNLATLCTTNFTLLAIHHISKPSAGRKRLEFIFLWIFHILLGGGFYFGFCVKPENGYSVCIPPRFARIWLRIHPAWILFVFFWNLIPSISIVLKVTKLVYPKFGFLQLWKRIYIADNRLILLLLVQMIIALIYCILGILGSATNVFGDNYVVYTVAILGVLLLSFNSLINFLQIERLIGAVILIADNSKDGIKSTAKTQVKTKLDRC